MLKRDSPVVCYCLHDDHWHLGPSIRSFHAFGKVICFVSSVAWDGTPGQWKKTVEVAEEQGAEVILGDWPNEQMHRKHSLAVLKERGRRFVITPDGDEIIESALGEALLKVAETNLADRVYVQMDTYWKSAEYKIRPRERKEPLLMLNLENAAHVFIREYSGGRALTLDSSHGVLHHLSYAGPDERIRRKIMTWGHKNEVVDGWWSNVWSAWDHNKLLRNLHPTHSVFYGWVERVELPEALRLVGVEKDQRPTIAPLKPLPSLSVVIPVFGGRDDLRACLESLKACQDLIHEVIVVDNGSPDDSAELARTYEKVTVIANESNLGFAAASNQGCKQSSGEVVLFLNNDTIMPRAGLVRLIESLMSSGSVAAAGPYSNKVSGAQQLDPTYTSVETISLFAEDFATRRAQDIEVDMLVGFCLAARRSAIDEVGLFDEAFGIGTFEDNDLCYRLRRKGYRLLIASRSFVHHEGSKTLLRMPMHPVALLRKNENLFRKKWRDDIESGYATGLPGLTTGRVEFRPENRPEARTERIAELRERANVSLCMIVRDEERVLGECLRSASPFFKQIVVVDTGSTDRTKEIALAHGAELFEMPWEDSFSVARNESLKYAKGQFVYWMDADDTLPWSSGEAILQAAFSAKPDLHGFVIPVQFIEDGLKSGTRVDHLKMFRNLPGLRFKFRIHEQILPSLREHGGLIARLDAVVFHSGYDKSPEGQARKEARDDKLLALDLEENHGHPFVLFNLGMSAHYRGRHQKAVEWLEQSILASGAEESHIRKAYVLLAVSLKELGRETDARTTIEKGLQTVGDDPELHFQAGLLLTSMNSLADAKAHYLAIRPEIEGHFSSIDTGILYHKRFFNLGSVSLLMGNYTEAKDWWLKSIEAEQGFSPSYFSLFDAAIRAADHATAQMVLEMLRKQEGPGPNWVKMAVQYAEAVGGPENSRLFLERASVGSLHAQLALARRYLETERVDLAMPMLARLEASGSPDAAFLLGVCSLRSGNIPEAIRHTQIAHELHPSDDRILQQLKGLEAASLDV